MWMLLDLIEKQAGRGPHFAFVEISLDNPAQIPERSCMLSDQATAAKPKTDIYQIGLKT